MNPALTIEPQVIAPAELGELLAFVGLPSKRSAKDLSGAAEEAFKGITGIIDELLLRAISKRTHADFVATREAIFDDYAKTIRALSQLVRIAIPDRVIDRLVGESFSELESDLREQGTMRFGTTAKDQAIFTVWTLRRTSGLLARIHNAGPAPKELKEKDARLAAHFSFCAACAHFHLDCLITAIRLDKPIHPEILPDIIDGMRAAVNAYGLVRQGVDLRLPPSKEPEFSRLQWDSEDQELLDSSMRDLDTQIVDIDPAWGAQQPEIEVSQGEAPHIAHSEGEVFSTKSSNAFGTHLREGVEIIKDWIEHPNPRE
jgi:hypothetical protein